MEEEHIISYVSNKNFFTQSRAWKKDSYIITDAQDYFVILQNIDTKESIKLPLKEWRSLIMFLAESLLLADLNSLGIEMNADISLHLKLSE